MFVMKKRLCSSGYFVHENKQIT